MANALHLTHKIRLTRMLTQHLLLVAGWLPVLFLIHTIQRFSVNVPFLDDWVLVDLFRKVAAGEATVADFFAQHSEHRIVFPRLILTVIAFLTHWNVNYTIASSVGLYLITLLLLYRMASQQTNRSTLHRLASLGTSLALFSFIQFQNWLWDFQIAWFLVNTCLVLSVFWLATGTHPIWLRVTSAAICCTVASFSLAQGLLTWIAVVPMLLTLKDDRRSQRRIHILLVWAVLCIGCVSLYFYGYAHPSYRPSVFDFLSQPIAACIYFLTLLGNALVYHSDLAAVVGGLLLLNFLVFVVLCFSLRGSGFAQAAACWISIGLFAILFACVTTVGRLTLVGIASAYSTRYTTPTLLLIVALLQLWRLVLAEWVPVKQSNLAMMLVVGLLVIQTLINTNRAIPEAQQHQANLTFGKTCLELSEHIGSAIDTGLRLIRDNDLDTSFLRRSVRELNQLGWRKDPRSLALLATASPHYGNLDLPKSTATGTPLIQKSCLNCNGLIEMAGWAILPKQRKPATLVLVSYGNTFFSTASVNLPSSDVASALNSKRYDVSRWRLKFPADALPVGDTVLKAWVYDPKKAQLVKLPGEVAVRVTR